MTRENYINWLEQELQLMKFGCSNYCSIRKDNSGQHTNGICQCGPYKRSKLLRWIAREIDDNGKIHTWPKD